MNKRPGVVIKSERELSIMREAGRINAMALVAAMQAVKPGATTAEVDAAAANVLTQHGAKPAFLGYPGPYPYPAVTNVCINEELVHGIPSPRQLSEGDIVSIDCGTILDGYVGDSAITVPVGEVSSEAQRLMDVTSQALYVGIEKMRPGNRTGDVSASIQQWVEGEGFNVVRQYTGHGVGRDMHEDPQVPNYGSFDQGMDLRSGMTIALEPMVLSGSAETEVLQDQWTVASRDGELTAHFEHTVAITDEGPMILTALGQGDLDGLHDIRYNQYFAGWSQVIDQERTS
jgi:methionyl aminopeptidase